jgi:hypothetical protein
MRPAPCSVQTAPAMVISALTPFQPWRLGPVAAIAGAIVATPGPDGAYVRFAGVVPISTATNTTGRLAGCA